MSPRAILATVVLVALPGCDKAKSFLGSSGGAAGGVADILPGGDANPELEAMVSRDGDGVRFRRDLTFPSELEIRMQVATSYENVRLVEDSAFGKKASVLNERQRLEVVYRKAPGVFNIHLERVGKVMEEDEKEKEGDVPVEVELHPTANLAKQSIEFVLFKEGWGTRRESGPVDFQKVVWADSIEDRIPELMVESGAHPRVQWFSSSRTWREGDQITLTGGTLKIIDPNDGRGRVALVFAGTESVGGHPCGVFAVKGEYEVEDYVYPDGERVDAEVSVTDGKIWASLLYPVILREEYDTVQTLERSFGKKGGVKTKIQGTVKVRRSRDWRPGGE